MKLHTYGLLRDSFRLEEKMEGVRTIWRLRDRHVKDASRAVQHMQKALTKMNIQLANVISDITGVSGQAIIAAILKGERDPWKLADLKHEMVKASRDEVARSLEGNWRDDLLFELRQAVDSYYFAHQQMRECDRKLESFLASLPTRTLERPDRSGESQVATTPQQRKARKKPKTRRNEPTIDLKAELKRICGVDLTSIDGIDVITAQTIVSEIGTDMSGFPTENHFASWLGLAPTQGYQRRKNHRDREEKSAKPGGDGITNGGHHLVKQQDLPGKPLSTLAQATALLCGGDQGHGPLSGGAGLPPAHPRRSLGGSRRRAVRAEAQRTGTGDSKLHHGREDPVLPARRVPPGVIREALALNVTTAKAVYEQKEPYTDEEVEAILEQALLLNGGTHGYAKRPQTFPPAARTHAGDRPAESECGTFRSPVVDPGHSLWIYTFAPQKKKRTETQAARSI